MKLGKRPTSEMPTKDGAYLVVMTGPNAGRRARLEGVMLVGRDPTADVRLDAPDVSRHHVRLKRGSEGRFVVEDLKSRNGTLVNGVRLRGSQTLNYGDAIQMGGEAMVLFTGQSPLEEHLIESRKMEAISQLAGGIAHNFNNLMAVVLTNVNHLQDLARRGPMPTAKASSCLKDVEVAARRAVEVTNQLLSFAQAREQHAAVTDVSALIEEVSATLRNNFPSSIEVRAWIEPGLRVVADRAQMQQVLTNLCLNARDAMPDGGTLTIDAEQADVSKSTPLIAGPHVVIAVRDTGVGMSHEVARRAFEPFFTTKEDEDNAGLGLASVYGIVKAHGGHVTVDTKVEEGSEFTIYLPTAEEAENTLVAGDRPTSTETVLLADSDRAMLNDTRCLLEQLGCDVICAEDGREAVMLFIEHGERITFTLLDLGLPTMDGVETLRMLRRINPSVRAIITSGDAHEERRVRGEAEALGAAFLGKPFDRQGLMDAISHSLRGPV